MTKYPAKTTNVCTKLHKEMKQINAYQCERNSSVPKYSAKRIGVIQRHLCSCFVYTFTDFWWNINMSVSLFRRYQRQCLPVHLKYGPDVSTASGYIAIKSARIFVVVNP